MASTTSRGELIFIIGKSFTYFCLRLTRKNETLLWG